MGTQPRMPFDERRKLIITRVRELFAHKGLEGATSRELAQAAGVSEGLLFKHFPNKEALFLAMLESLEASLPDNIQKSLSLEPSTSPLILIVHTLVTELLSLHSEEFNDITRIYLRSLAGDGEFAHVALRKARERLIPKIEENIKAAEASGDIDESLVPYRMRAWFVDRLAFVLLVDLLPPVPAVDYRIPRGELVREAVRFLLRGIGLKEEVIRRLYTAEGAFLDA